MIAYLETLLPKTQTAAPVEEAKVNEDLAKKLEQNKLVPMVSKKQLEEQALANWGGGKGKGGKKNRQRVKKPSAAANKINHTVDSLNKFSSSGVKIPSTIDDIPATITALQEKIQYYEDLPVPDKPEKTPESPSEEVKEAKKAPLGLRVPARDTQKPEDTSPLGDFLLDRKKH